MASPPAASSSPFPDTTWSLVARARESRESFGVLLSRYRTPLVAFAQAKLAVSRHEAEDAVSDLYAALLEKDSPLLHVHPAHGRFRSWLATCLQNEVMTVWRRASALKRGGGIAPISLDATSQEYPCEVAVAADDPAEAFDRAFARTLYDGVLSRFLAEAADLSTLEGRVRRIAFEGEGAKEQELMDAFGVSRKTVSRARASALGRFRALLREEVAHLVDNPSDLDSELAWLRSCLS